jgi:hypothetical protein
MAVAVDSQESANAGHRGVTSGTALTWTFTNTAGTLLIVAIGVTETSGGGGVAVTAASYNGTAMTAIGTSVTWGATSSNLVTFYYLKSPATGANTVSVTGTGHGGFAIIAGAVSFTGSDATTPLGTAVTSTGSSTHATTAAITTASGNYIIGAGGQGSGNAMAPDAGQTETWEKVGSGSTAGDNGECVIQASTGSAITPGFTWTGSDSWGMIAVDILASSGGGATVTYPMLERLTRGLDRGLTPGMVH